MITLLRPRTRTLALAALALMAAAAIVLLAAAPALGQDTGDASPDAPVGSVFTINNSLVLLLTGLVVPLANGILQHPANPAWLKIGLAGALSAVANAFVQTIQDDGTAILSQEWLLQTLTIFATAIGTYLGVWNPLTARRGGLNAVTGPGLVQLPERQAA